MTVRNAGQETELVGTSEKVLSAILKSDVGPFLNFRRGINEKTESVLFLVRIVGDPYRVPPGVRAGGHVDGNA
jgi:hypothetical protein